MYLLSSNNFIPSFWTHSLLIEIRKCKIGNYIAVKCLDCEKCIFVCMMMFFFMSSLSKNYTRRTLRLQFVSVNKLHLYDTLDTLLFLPYFDTNAVIETWNIHITHRFKLFELPKISLGKRIEYSFFSIYVPFFFW